MRAHLTDLFVRSLKPTDGRYRVWDKKTPGFGVSINGGSKSWVVMFGERRQLKVLGRYPDLSLSEARVVARKALARAPIRESGEAIILMKAASAFLTACQQRVKPRTTTDYRRFLERYLVPKLGSRELRTIGTKDVIPIIDALKDTPSEQNHAHTIFSVFFSWCVRRDLMDVNPIARLNLPSRIKTRSRTLNDSELKKVWQASGDRTFGLIVRLCILLGQRRSEIGMLRWEWIDREKRLITFPATVMKNNLQHTIPYGDMAEKIFSEVPRLSQFLFPGRDDNETFQGWAKSKRELNLRSGVSDWTLHDLRRSFATNLAALGIPIHVTEKLLSHVSGTMGGIVGIYQRHDFMREMRDAIRTWETKLATDVQT